MKPTAKLELITPEWAIKELEKHEDELSRGLYHQRPFNEVTANGYAIAMQNGHWLVNDQGIMFDTNGWLRDGRHRLWAVVMSGVAVEMWVMRHCSDKEINGIKINVVDTVDIGRKRDVGQQLAIDGVQNSTRVASASRMIARICCGFPRAKLTVIQTRQILEIYGTQITKACDALHNAARLCLSPVVAPMAMYRMISPGPADQFGEDYFSMQNLPPGSPVIALQKWIGINGVGGTHGDNAARAAALAMSHYEKRSLITNLRHSDLGIQWLLEKQKTNAIKVRDIMGTNFHDHRN